MSAPAVVPSSGEWERVAREVEALRADLGQAIKDTRELDRRVSRLEHRTPGGKTGGAS